MEAATAAPATIADGVYEDMTMEEYLAVGRPTLDKETGELVAPEERFISSGIVKEMFWKSEFHALQKLTGEAHKDSSARQKLGSLTHTAVLEPEKMETAYKVLPRADGRVFTKDDGTPSKTPRNTVKYKEVVRNMREARANRGKEFMEWEQVQAAKLVVEGVERCRDAKALIEAPGQIELTVIATDPITGLRVKCRFDKWLTEVGWDLNLKGCRSAKFWNFQKDVSQMHFIGAGFYKMVAEWAGLEWKRSVILALELDPPHVVKPWEMYPDVIDGGERVTRWGLDRLAKAIESETWPAYGDQIEGMALTEFAYRQIDERLEQ